MSLPWPVEVYISALHKRLTALPLGKIKKSRRKRNGHDFLIVGIPQMDVTPVAHNAIPSSYNQRQRSAALSQLQTLTNQYNAALSSFAQSFTSEIPGGKAYYYDLANLVRIHPGSLLRFQHRGDGPQPGDYEVPTALTLFLAWGSGLPSPVRVRSTASRKARKCACRGPSCATTRTSTCTSIRSTPSLLCTSASKRFSTLCVVCNRSATWSHPKLTPVVGTAEFGRRR